MIPVSGEMEDLFLQATEAQGFKQKYRIQRLIMSTSLYSVYLVLETDQIKNNEVVLLIEHLPASEPAAHVLPVHIRESASKTETMKEIVAAVDEHFAQNNGAPTA